jgi:hypothetical protein
MPPMTPEMVQYMLEQNIQQWSDRLNVNQKVMEYMTRQAQQGVPLDQTFEAVQGGSLGEHMVHTRGTIEAMQNYLTQARAALAQGGQAMSNFVGRMGNAGVQIADEATGFYAQHQTETNTLASATGGKVVQYTVQSAATGAEGAAAGAIGETTAAAGAIGETTAAAGAIAETTAAAGAIAETTVAAGGVAVAEASAGSTIAAGAASGSWLGPVGIVVGIAVAGVIAGGVYVFTHSGDKKPAAAVSIVSSSPDSDSESTSDSQTTTTEAETTTSPPARSLDGTYQITSTVVGGGTKDLTCVGHEATVQVHATATTFDFGALGTSVRGPGDTFTLTAPATAPDGSAATETVKGDFDPDVDPPTLSGTDTLAFEGGVECDFTIAGVRTG